MLLHEGLTHILSQIEPWLLSGASFTLRLDCTKRKDEKNIYSPKHKDV